MSYSIRRAQLDDADGLADLLRNLHYFQRLQAEPPDLLRARVRKHLDLCLADQSHSVYVATGADGQIAGYSAVHWLPYLILSGPEGFVSELFVAETARSAQLGTRLLEAAAEEAKTRGCARLSLINMRDRESYQRGFYRKRGWEERTEAANFLYFLP